MDYIKETDNGLLLSIKVMPNSSKNELIKQDSILKLKIKVIPNSSKNELTKTETGLRLKITAPPVDNKANKFVVNYLSKIFKVPKTSIKILYGELSREKTILFSGITEDKCNNIM